MSYQRLSIVISDDETNSKVSRELAMFGIGEEIETNPECPINLARHLKTELLKVSDADLVSMIQNLVHKIKEIDGNQTIEL